MAANKNRYDVKINNDKFKIRLSELLDSKETIVALKNELGCTEEAIRQYSKGKIFPKTHVLLQISRFFGCSLDYLIGLSDVKSPDATIQSFCEETGLSEDSLYNLNSCLESGDGFTTMATDHLLSDYFEIWQEISMYIFQAASCARVANRHVINEEEDISDIAPFIADMRDTGDFTGVNKMFEMHLPAGYIPLKSEDAKNYYIQMAHRKFLDFIEKEVEMRSNAHIDQEAKNNG